MNGYLLDTNVLSELRRSNGDRGVASFADSQWKGHIFTTAVNFAEIRFGIAKLADTTKRYELALWLNDVMRPWFGPNIVQLDEAVLCEWRMIVDAGRQRRFTFPEPDCLIAAAARVNALVVVTRDVTPFREARVPVLDPWRGRFFNSADACLEPLSMNYHGLLVTLMQFESSKTQ